MDWNLDQGEILGLVGRNGAGKSTILRAVLDLVRLDSGTVILEMLGGDNRRHRRQLIGYISDRQAFYGWMTVRKTLTFYSVFYPKWNASLVEDLLTRFGLAAEKQVADLSTGNALKLSLIVCLSQGAKILILDEPTSGLDPVIREEFLSFVRTSVQEGWIEAVIFASHVLAEVESICTRVVVLNRGKIVESFSLRSLESPSGHLDPAFVGAFNERCLEAMR